MQLSQWYDMVANCSDEIQKKANILPSFYLLLMIAMIIHILLVYFKLPIVLYIMVYLRIHVLVHIVDSLYSKINKLILGSHETRQPRITNCDVRTAIKGLKSEKSDGFTDLTSDRLINGTDLLFKCISNVLTIMLQHGYAPTHFIVSTIVPIPKCKKSNLKCSEKYRPIAISSLLGKVFDIIISQQHDFLFCFSSQFGFFFYIAH